MFTIKGNRYNVRNKLNLTLTRFETIKHGKQSIMYDGTQFCNLLANDVKQTVRIDVFERFIRK